MPSSHLSVRPSPRSARAVDRTSYQQGRGLSFALFGAGYTGAFQHHLFSWLHTNCHGSILAGCLDVSALLDACVRAVDPPHPRY